MSLLYYQISNNGSEICSWYEQVYLKDAQDAVSTHTRKPLLHKNAPARKTEPTL
jgi:ribosomal protein S20